MKKWLLLAVVGLLSACTKSGVEELNVAPNADAPTFYASVEGADAETRTYLDANQKMRWTNDDRITIFFGDNYNREFAFTGKTGALSGGFKQISVDDEFMAGTKMTANYALYPHSSETMLDPSGYFECELPAVQNYAEGSFGLNANTMVSVTQSVEDRFLQFKNVSSYLKLNLYGDDVTVAQITLQGNNNEPLAGAAIITPTYGGEPTLTWAASGTTQVLTLDCGVGVKIGQTEEEATAFYLVVPPTTFEKGFTVTITDTEGKVCTKSTSNEQNFTRNVTKNMPAFEAKCKAPNPVPSNQIWYTSTDGNIVTPKKTDAFGVAIKSNTYTDGKGVITFEGDVTTIGESAFQYCESLASITLPEGVTTIGDYAFRGCTSLASITIPESVTEIGIWAFSGCTSLKRVDISDIAAWCKISFAGTPSNPMSNGASLYLNGTLVEDLIIPDEITEMKQYAFANCTSLASITLPKSLTTIGELAFESCTSLASITIPEGVTTIGMYAFSDCTSLASITLSAGLTSIGRQTFDNCTSLASITIPESVTEIGNWAFSDCTSLKRVDISDIAAWCKISFAGVASNPMYNGASLYLNGTLVEDLIIPDEITEMKQYAFANCTSLASITIPEGVTEIGERAFFYCTSLASVTLPEGVTTIGNAAFYGCKSLTSITIPEGVTTIGEQAFRSCTSLASISIPAGVTTIGRYAFSGCTSLAKFEGPLATSDQRCIVIDGTLVCFAPAGLTEYVIPAGVTTIGPGAFLFCESLASITLPESLTTIGESAFYYCTSLASVYCKPTTPPTGRSDMFSGNASGRKIYVPAGSVDAYKAAEYWKNYASDIVAEE